MLPAFEEWLNTRLANDKKQWKKIYTKTITHQLEKKITKIKTVTRPQWLLSKKTELRSILKNPTDIALHEVRKIYKDLQYIEEWAQKNKVVVPVTLPGELAKNGKRLGQYHDRVIAVEYITKYIQQEKVKAAKKEAEIQQKKWVTQKANQKKTLLRSLSNSF